MSSPVSFGNVGSVLTQPQAPARGAPVPQEQLNKWQQFRQRLQQDPNLRMALLTTGLNMLRTPPIGQTGFDTFADAAVTGVETFDALNQRTRTQGLEDRDREFRESTTTRGIEQADERIDIARTGVEQRDEAFTQRGEQFDARMEHFRNQLAEDQRQFDDRLEAGGFAGANASTGAERQAQIAANAFITSGIYPDTASGRAMAELRAQKLVGRDLVNPRDRFEYASDLAADMMLFNRDMTEQEAAQRAMALANELANLSNAEDPATPDIVQDGAADTIDVPHPVLGAGTATLLSDGTYDVVFPGGQTKNVSAEVLNAWLGGQQ